MGASLVGAKAAGLKPACSTGTTDLRVGHWISMGLDSLTIAILFGEHSAEGALVSERALDCLTRHLTLCNENSPSYFSRSN